MAYAYTFQVLLVALLITLSFQHWFIKNIGFSVADVFNRNDGKINYRGSVVEISQVKGKLLLAVTIIPFFFMFMGLSVFQTIERHELTFPGISKVLYDGYFDQYFPKYNGIIEMMKALPNDYITFFQMATSSTKSLIASLSVLFFFCGAAVLFPRGYTNTGMVVYRILNCDRDYSLKRRIITKNVYRIFICLCLMVSIIMLGINYVALIVFRYVNT